MKITVLVGGVGGAKFLLGVRHLLTPDPVPRALPAAGDRLVDGTPDGASGASAAEPEPGQPRVHSITAIVNTADDIRLHGLQICPDLDSCMYTLGGGADLQRGWGRQGETWTVSAELAAYGSEAPWFSLGDKDMATHIMRTRMLDAGYPLSAVTAALCGHWQPGVTLLPMTDERVETHVVVTDPEPPAGEEPGMVALHFQEWWIRYGAALPAHSITPIGVERAVPGPGVLAAIAEADVILIAPSNPVVSVGTVLAVPGIRESLLHATAKIIGVSPIIGGAPVRGHADACLSAIDVDTTAEAVGRHYGARSAGGLLDGWLIADGDSADIPGVTVRTAPLLMTDPETTATMVVRCLDLAGLAAPAAPRSEGS